MLFFFELFLFVLIMLTLALGELVSRWLALVLWLVVTVFALIGYVLARRALAGVISGEPAFRRAQGGARGGREPTAGPPADDAAVPEEPAPLDEKWARTLLYNWRRSNVLLVLGVLAVGGWYWLAG